MDFLFVNSTNFEVLNKSNQESLLCGNEITNTFSNGFIKYSSATNILKDEDNIHLIFSGRVKYDNLDAKESIATFYNDLKQLHWPLNDTIQGYFSGVLIDKSQVLIFNDPIGSYRLYYYEDETTFMVSSNLTAFYEVLQLDLNQAALLLEITPSYTQYGRMTVLEGVHRLMPGELIRFSNNSKTSFFDRTIKVGDSIPEKGYVNNLVELINSSFDSFYEEEVIISLSGGIDSRVGLSALLNSNKKFEAVNYGDKQFIDSKIPFQLSKKFKFPIRFYEIEPNLFPDKKTMFQLIKETDSLLINSWNGMLLDNRIKGKVFLIGDVNDILRAKRISSLKTREYRTGYYIKKLFTGKKHQFTPLNTELKKTFRDKKVKELIERALSRVHFFNFEEDIIETIIVRIEYDMHELFDHLDSYDAQYLESYEELFGLFTEGRLSMGKQLNFLKYNFKPEIPLANIRILRKVLNISPEFRYSDELTNKMFKHPSWRKTGRFPTSQNPLVPYNYPYYFVLLGWFIRSKADHYLTKLNLFTKGKFRRKRLFKTFDLQATYSYKGAYENFASYFEGIKECNSENVIDRFKRRRDKKSWPIASLDLMPYVQCAYYLKTFKSKK